MKFIHDLWPTVTSLDTFWTKTGSSEHFENWLLKDLEHIAAVPETHLRWIDLICFTHETFPNIFLLLLLLLLLPPTKLHLIHKKIMLFLWPTNLLSTTMYWSMLLPITYTHFFPYISINTTKLEQILTDKPCELLDHRLFNSPTYPN